MSYWQVAAGDGRQEYSKVFLKHGVMLIGSGSHGPYFENKKYYRDTDGQKDVSYFAEQVKDGDIVVLKRPSGKLWEVIAVGTVEGKYDYLPTFDDVDGWNLQHCRYVKWRKPQNRSLIHGLARGTFKRIHKPSTIRTISNLKSGTPIPSEKIPKPSKMLKDEDLIEILINQGLRPKDAEDFAQTIRRIRRLVKWYHDKVESVSEHETRTFLIIPLLLALGWPEQKLKIEWNNTDIAFFEKPYSSENENSNECIIILESKRLWDGLSYVSSQAKTYASKYPKCSRLIVSDGCCYRLFKRDNNTWNYSAYLNVLKPKYKHPYEPKIGGATDIFLSLMGK